jgi:hypothetical protein
MEHSDRITEKLALSLLARDGIAVIWKLHIAAAQADRSGYPAAAAAILQIADAAEAAWVRSEEARTLVVG